MAESADALDLGSSAARRAGSTPVMRTKNPNQQVNKGLYGFIEKIIALITA